MRRDPTLNRFNSVETLEAKSDSDVAFPMWTQSVCRHFGR